MRVRYFVKTATNDISGYGFNWNLEATTDTIEEALKEVEKRNLKRGPEGWYTGNYRIVKKTIDEEAFTVTEEVVIEYDWWEEVGYKKSLMRSIECCKEEIEKEKARKVRSENGEKKRQKAIKTNEEMIKFYERKLSKLG